MSSSQFASFLFPAEINYFGGGIRKVDRAEGETYVFDGLRLFPAAIQRNSPKIGWECSCRSAVLRVMGIVAVSVRSRFAAAVDSEFIEE
jgi:hypothetical protein